MNLIREECEKALNGLRILEREENFKKWNQVAPQIKCDVIESLIHEHYDNPPLEFEELKEKTWYWYEPSKSWIYLFKSLDWEPVKGLRYGERIINHSVEGYYMDFKEGTLFRKQVEE